MKLGKKKTNKYQKIVAIVIYLTLLIVSILNLNKNEPHPQSPKIETKLNTKIEKSTIENNMEQAIVTEVVDGDTIKLNNGKTLRYIGIDTPETRHPKKSKGCFGVEATAKNKELVQGKTITMIKDVKNTDRYGRLLRYVYIDDLFINEELVKQGYAFAVSYPPDIAKQDQLSAAENFARENKNGLWADGICPKEETSKQQTETKTKVNESFSLKETF
ncbi:MAG TPA: thermonuclease family protein [Candidatus Moranbacteria bacterium]|nr:thermonuclease family protein [Candidatus Moranbacteria bacterium]